MTSPLQNSYAPIGIIDSGIGGLSVWQEIKLLLPNESLLYIADTKECPYGSKTPEEIYSLARKLVTFLVSQEVKLIVIACNVISVTSLEKLRIDFPDIAIIGTVPVVKTAASITKNERIGILATETTAQSRYLTHLITEFAPECLVFTVGTPELVPLIEKGIVSGKKIQIPLEAALKRIKGIKADTLVLACTHFPFLREEIQAILGKKVTIIDSGAAVARQVKRVLDKNNTLAHNFSQDIFYTTGNKNEFQRVAETLLQFKGLNIIHLEVK